MRRFSLALFATAAFSQFAVAADLPVKAPIKAVPAMVAAYNWTGFYIGGFVGGAWASRNAVTTDPCNVLLVAACAAAGVGTYNIVAPTAYSLGSSFLGGGTIGFNYQSGAAVFGLEGEVGYLRLRGSILQNPLGLGDTFATTTIGNWYAAYTGRLGWAFDRSLLYVKGGGVSVQVNSGVIDAGAIGATLDTRSTTTRFGWALGGGFEHAFGGNWSVKAEYLYLGIQGDHVTTGVTNTGTTEQVITTLPSVHTAKVGLNYFFK
jgi:outer membrane immunogenic protein